MEAVIVKRKVSNTRFQNGTVRVQRTDQLAIRLMICSMTGVRVPFPRHDQPGLGLTLKLPLVNIPRFPQSAQSRLGAT